MITKKIGSYDNNVCQVIFYGPEYSAQLRVTAKIGSATYTTTHYVTQGRTSSATFEYIPIREGDNIEIKVVF